MPNEKVISSWDEIDDVKSVSSWDEIENIKPVKKKDVPAPKLESGSEATISSNGQSKSTSVSPTVRKPNPNNQTSFTVSKENSFGIPNFQIPGVQKNTFNPLTEQQKIAGKKALGEGTTIVEQQKVKAVTPEISAKKSAILKAVTGKDISYDEVSRLSDVSNTDYAGILAAQKEKQKTDNTFATNPALQEEKRQEQVKQSEFLGNREFKVNNPQANIQILEQKNPTLLKDIADKTLELDEQRTAESLDKEKPVSERFTKPKSDVPYKPFTDYLEVDELVTVSPMELFETREKESDRDKQLKYFQDRGKNDIFNEYDNEQTAISYKQSELKKKYDTAVNNLKGKYGENWLDGAEQGDKDLADLISAQAGLQENYNLSRDLLNTDKYAEVNKTIQERAQRQAEIDKTAKEDTWYKFTDESNKIQNVVKNTVYGFVNDIASLPRFVNGVAGGNEFNWTDKVADATQRFTDSQMAYYNTPTDMQRDNVQDYAEVDGYRVFLDKNGNPTSLRDADNFMVNNDAKKEEIFNKYSENKDKIKVKTDWIDGEQILNQSSKIIGDMLVMMAEGGGIGSLIKGSGKLSRSGRLVNLAENAKLTTSLAVISQMQNELMNDAIDKGMSKEDAAKYAAISSAGVAAISMINPMEAQFLKNLKNVKSLASEEVASFVNGGTTLADLTKKTIGNIVGNSVPEIAEEQFFEPVLQNVVNESYQSQIGVNQQLEQTDVLGRENLSQSVLTATTTFLPSVMSSSKDANSNAVKMDILENPENWMAIIDKKKELGIIEDDVYSAEVAAMNKAKKKYDALKSEVKQSDRTKLAGLIGDKVAIESKLSDAPELKPKYENQVKEIDSKISNLTNGITEAPEIEQAGAINIQSQDFGENTPIDKSIALLPKPQIKKLNLIEKGLDKVFGIFDKGDTLSEMTDSSNKSEQAKYESRVEFIKNNKEFADYYSEANSSQREHLENMIDYYVKNKDEYNPNDIHTYDYVRSNGDVEFTGKGLSAQIEDFKNVGRTEDGKIDWDKVRYSVISPEGKVIKSGIKNDEIHEALIEENKSYSIKKTNKNEQINQNVTKQQDNGDSSGMAGSEQNGEAIRAKSEQGKLSNEDEIQQNTTTTEVQKQITEVEKIISELEDNPNSPFHKLVNLDEQKQKLSELQKKEAEVKKESAQPVLPETKAQKAANPRLSALPKKKEVPTEKVEEGVGETESIKNRSRKDLFPDESEFSDVIGGSGKNSKISSYKEVNGIGISEYKNPDSGVVDVIMTGTSDNDYVGYVRIYENGKPTERWTSKMENKSGNKANFKTMISEVKNLLPANHEYTESTNISLDGIRVYANNLTRGYEILTDKDGNPITNNVELNGATLQGLKDAKSDRDVSKLYNKRTGITRDEFNKIREKVNELLSGTRLLFNEANGSVIIKLPVLKSKETAKSNPRIAELPKKKAAPTATLGDDFSLDLMSLPDEKIKQTIKIIEDAKSKREKQNESPIGKNPNGKDGIKEVEPNKEREKRSEAEIKGELKIKEAELKLLEDKQSKLNAQLEKNLKENQLDLLQGAKPQSMFDDKVEQQKVAESLKNDIDKKRKEVAKLQDELDNINQEEIPFQSTDKKFTTITEDAFTKLLDKLKKAFPNVKVELFGKGNLEEAKKALEKYGVDIIDMLSVWHGSPHNFDRFSTDKIGTGEGNQAFGWGLYFTDLKSIAETYANSLSNNKFEIAKESLRASVLSDVEDIIGKPLTAMQKAFIKNLVRFDYNTQRVWLNKPNTAELFVAATVANTGYNFGDGYREWEIFKDVLPKIQDYDQTFEKDRNLYKVSLHKGKTPEQYTWLEWDKQVPKKIQGIIDNSGILNKEETLTLDEVNRVYEQDGKWKISGVYGSNYKTKEDALSGLRNILQKPIKSAKDFYGEGLYNEISKILGSDKEASLFLLDLGIDGIKYPAESISRGATSDNARGFNYVVFDDKALSIEEKIQFLKTKDGTIYGFKTPDGKVFINTDNLNANTPIHEFGHIWQSVFPSEFSRGIALLLQSPQGRELINEIRKNPAYKGKTITDIQAEALVTAIGNKGEEIFKNNPSALKRFQDWLNYFFKRIGDKLGIKNLSADDKFDMFTKKVVGELLGGKVLSKDVGKTTSKTITFQGENIKVKEINGGAEVVNGFYSPLEKIIGETKFDKLPVKQWIEKFGKGEEAKWTGLTDWLNSQEGSVSKSDIQQYLKDNRIEVVEVVKSDDNRIASEAEILDAVYSNDWVELGNGVRAKGDIGGFSVVEINGNKQRLSRVEAENLINKELSTKDKSTKFQNYQLEGEKENHKEVLVTIPVKPKTGKKLEVRAKDSGFGIWNNNTNSFETVAGTINSREEAQRRIDAVNKMGDNESIYDRKDVFRSSHFDEPNILVHLRMNTRTDAEGNKVLFLEEVQSDWGQKGRKEGFTDTNFTKQDAKRVKELNDKFDTEGLSQQEMTELTNLRRKEKGISLVPTAPFVTDTNAWTKLALKVALKEAVKQGADKIAWTTGEQQVGRYEDDFRKQVDKIETESKKAYGSVYVTAYKNGKVVFENDMPLEGKTNVGGKDVDLEDVVGKEIANKIRNGEQTQKFEGKDLTIGGKGMKGFYGSPAENSLGIVGNVAKSLFKQEPKTVELNKGKDEKIKAYQYDGTQNVSGMAGAFYLKKGDWIVETPSGFKMTIDANSKEEAIKEFKNTAEDTSVNIGEYSQSTQHSIDITPEMKAMVEFGQPLFQILKDANENEDNKKLFDEAFQWYKDNDYTYEEAKKELDDNDVDYNEKDLKDIFAEKKEADEKKLDSSKQRVADRFVKGNNDFENVRQFVINEGYDKGDYDSKQIFKDIDNLIEKAGTENIEQLLDLPLSEPHRVVLQSKIFEHFGKQSTDENLSEEERKIAFEKSARYLLEYSRQRTEAGRGNAILNQIYLDSDIYFTLPMMMKKMDALGTILSDTEMAEIDKMSKEIEQLRKENKELQELAKKDEEQQTIEDIKTHLLVDELIISSQQKDDVDVQKAKTRLGKNFQKIAEKFGSIKMLEATEKANFFEILHEMTKDLMTISKVNAKKAVRTVIKSIKQQHSNIDDKLLNEAQEYILGQEKEETEIEDSKGNKITKGDLLELIEDGANTMDKMVEAIREKYHGGDKTVTDKQIRDSITNYGNSIKKDKTEVEKTLSEIKSLMLLQSKLEDALQNVPPKKTGTIREKDTIAVIQLRRELAEAMKKLTTNISENEIAGLNERKLTYLSNRIKEVQEVINGLNKKINTKAPFEYNEAVKEKQKELDDLMKQQDVLLHFTKEKLTNLIEKYQKKIDNKIYSKNPILTKLSITDAEHQKLKKTLEEKKRQLKNERETFKQTDANTIWNKMQKNTDRQIERLDELLKGIDRRKTSWVSEQVKRYNNNIIDNALDVPKLAMLRLNQQRLEAKKEEWEKKIIRKEIEAELANKSKLRRLAGSVINNLISLSRTATLGLIDVGWIGVQGGYFMRTAPLRFKEALQTAYTNGDLDEKSFNEWRKNLKDIPLYEKMLKSGLRIPSQSLREELFEQEYRESAFTNFLEKLPIAKLVNKNGRLSVKFLAHLRMEVFNEMYNKLNAWEKQDQKTLEKLADFVNVHSGAGGVIGESKNGSLNKAWSLLTSARNTSSMLQQTYLGMIYQVAKYYDHRKPLKDQSILFQQVKNDVINQLVLFSSLFIAQAIAKYADDDDEKMKDWEIEYSPFSTDFLKLKGNGKKYFDMGGTTSLNVATLRLATMMLNVFGADIDNYKTKSGYSQIGGSQWNDKSGLDILGESSMNRLAPFLSPFKNALIAKRDNNGNYNMFGEEYTPNQFRLKLLLDMLAPINAGSVVGDITDEKQNAIQTVGNFLINSTGVGVQDNKNKTGKGSSRGTTRGTDSRGSDSRTTTR